MQCPWEWSGDQCSGSGQGVCPVVTMVSGVTHDPGRGYCSAGIQWLLKGRIEVVEGTRHGADMEDQLWGTAVGDKQYPATVGEGEDGVKATYQSASFGI